MTDMPRSTNEQPIFPPQYLLFLAGIGVLLALGVYISQGSMNVIGWAGVVIAVLSLVAWVFLAPRDAMRFLTGRNLRFGATSVFVTLLLIVAMIAIYAIVRQQGWRYAVTATDQFTLTDSSRQAVAALGADPNAPEITIQAFFGTVSAGRRDQIRVLLDDYVRASDGKISYEFIDPNRAPGVAGQYGIEQPEQFAVTRVGEDGEPVVEGAEVVSNIFQQDFNTGDVTINQQEITNAIVRAASTGEFQAFILQTEGGVTLEEGGVFATLNSINAFNQELQDTYDWTTETVTLADLASDRVNLQDEALDGSLLIIGGGNGTLDEASFNAITEYLNNGGNALIYAGLNPEGDQSTIVTSQNFSDYLFENYGVRFNPRLVLDDPAAAANAQRDVNYTYVEEFDPTHPITAPLANQPAAEAIFSLPLSIETADTPPANVNVTPLLFSAPESYSKSIDELLAQNFEQTEEDPAGPFTLAAAAENTETNSRIVVFGSSTFSSDAASLISPLNRTLSLDAVTWATRLDDFFVGVSQALTENISQDQPIFSDAQELNFIRFVTVLLLPFGTLFLGVYVWWSGRERALNDRAAAANLTEDQPEEEV